MPQTEDITSLLQAASAGDRAASEKLIGIVYNDLKRVARRKMSLEQPGHTLQPTAIVNEVFFRLFHPSETGSGDWLLNPMEFQNRAQFLGLAARQMRLVLVDHARGKRAQKRDFGIKMSLDDANAAALSSKRDTDFEELDEQLNLLAVHDPDAAKVVELRFFGGLTDQEVVTVTGTNLTKVRRDWEFARSFLKQRLHKNKNANTK